MRRSTGFELRERKKRIGMSNEKQKWVVLKFGGTSVSSLNNWQTIRDICADRLAEGLRPLVVCSALAGVSDALESLLASALRGGHKEVLTALRDKHLELASDLGVDGEALLGEFFDELGRLAKGAHLLREVSGRVHARAMACGELMATTLGAGYLSGQGFSAHLHDARETLEAEENLNVSLRQEYLSANCCFAPDDDIRAAFDAMPGKLVVTQGFIARNEAGETVLLGRGGSDTSAAYFATLLSADRLEIWTDVPGMFTADPRQVPNARLLKALAYDEAQEITSMGAEVLHPRCLTPVRQHEIPVHIRCTTRRSLPGTVISSAAPELDARVKAISSKMNITLISMETLGMWEQVGFLADVFGCFKEHGLSIDLVSTSETNVTVSLDNLANTLTPDAVDALLADLKNICTPQQIGPCASVSLVGRNIRTILPELGQAFGVFEDARIFLVSQAANDLNMTFVVAEDQVARLIDKMHQQLFEHHRRDAVLGRTWEDIFDAKDEIAVPMAGAWWRSRAAELIALGEEESPRYVYDEDTLRQKARNLLALEPVDRVFYSMKANSYAPLLEVFHELGLNFECVSAGEIEYLFSLFPDLDPDRVLFTPNFAGRAEYEAGFARGVTVTLDNLYPLEHWPEVFAGRDIFVRVDPGQGRGHHDFVKTAGKQSKFGVSLDLLGELRDLAAANQTRIVGLHAHTGSGILTPGNWTETASTLAELVGRLPDVRVLDLGGGLGVVENPNQSPLDLQAVVAGLAEVKAVYPDLEIWLEPGRYLVATAGVLLTRVTQTKRKNDFYYVGVDTGMNSLMRPMLYGAYHEIVNLSRLDTTERIHCNVVGPICESGDVLGHERRIAPATDGDVVLVATAGAYGRVMASGYNRRPPATEKLLRSKND
jgi:bifunctional diaminopimelate decarboxylase / aspartate kinase